MEIPLDRDVYCVQAFRLSWKLRDAIRCVIVFSHPIVVNMKYRLEAKFGSGCSRKQKVISIENKRIVVLACDEKSGFNGGKADEQE